MSAKNRKGKNPQKQPRHIGIESHEIITETPERGDARLIAYIKRHWVMSGIVALAAVTVVASGLKYLDDDAKRQNQLAATDRSTLSAINPFVTAPPPSPTPQLSKSYIYAGSRLLAVEDANANAAPPADLAVWRPSNGYFYVLGGTGSAQVYFPWGTNGDIPVQGDFDGDGKTDFSIFRPATPSSSATWWIMKSSTLDTSYYAVPFGTTGDIPAPADYDGDGKTDIAIYRAGTWYIQQSSDNATIYPQFGLSTDIPAPADYDGDGRADIAVWRDSNKIKSAQLQPSPIRRARNERAYRIL